MSSSNRKTISIFAIAFLVFLSCVCVISSTVYAEDVSLPPVISDTPAGSDTSSSSDSEKMPAPIVKDDTTKIPSPDEKVTSEIPAPLAPDVTPDNPNVPPVPPATDYSKLCYDQLVIANSCLSAIELALRIFVYMIIPFMGAFYVILHFIIYPFKRFVS